MRKILSFIMAIAMITTCFVFASCGKTESKLTTETIKIGLITLHDDSSTYDKNFIDAMKRACAELGISEDQLIITTGVDETSNCYDAAKQMVNAGCNVIFADSFGHEDYIIQAAQEFTNVNFCHATGTKAHTCNLPNYSNAFASIYEGRYVAGVAAGMKLNEMIASGAITPSDAIVGYVGAYTYAEVISGYSAFYLGVKSICSSATMKVRFTGTWYDTDKEYAAAKALIETDHCVVISQHADSYGAPNACEEYGVPNISYNGSTEAQGPNSYVVSSKIDWTPYFKYMIQCTLNGEKIATDWVGTFATGSVVLLTPSKNAAAGTEEAMSSAIIAIKSGAINVFDTNTFTVNGEHITSYMADVDSDEAYTADTEVISGGIFYESKFRSAPYFNIQIDGITLINTAY